MSRIEKLTEEQIARFPEFVDRWTKIGLCTDPADRPRAEAAIREMYAQGGLAPPVKIVWCGSPLSQGLTRASFLHKRPIGYDIVFHLVRDDWYSVCDSVEASVWDSVGYSVKRGNLSKAQGNAWLSAWDSARDSIGYAVKGGVGSSVQLSVEDSVRDGVQDSLWYDIVGSVWNNVRRSVYRSVLDSVRESVRESVQDGIEDWIRDRLWDSVGESIYGAHNADWLAFFRYFHDVTGLTARTAKLSGLWELAQSAGWALPHENICWVSERHNILVRDGRGRLHCETGPACAYPDGFAIHAIHGVRVPPYVVERPAQITVARIDEETNAEVRRVMIERYRHGEEVSGGGAYVRDAGGERLDHDERYGTLWRRNVPDDEPIVMMEVINATPGPDGHFKHYWLRVPPQMQTAREAIAWTFDQPGADYAPKVET